MAITLVQSTSGGAKSVSGTATTLALTFANPTTAGNTVVILASYWNSGSGILTPTIGAESGITHVSKNDVEATPGGAHIFYKISVAGGSTTVSLSSNNSAANTFITAIALEFANVASADGAAVTNATAVANTTITTTAFAPTVDDDLILEVMQETNGANLTVTWASSNIGFENVGGGQGGSGRYKILTNASSQTATATFTTDGNDTWSTVILGLKASTAGAPTGKIVRLSQAVNRASTY